MELAHRGVVGQDIVVEEISQVGQVRRAALALAGELGMDEGDAGRAALIATELATNVLKHGSRGSIRLTSVPDDQGSVGIELCAVDIGPGFDLASCLADGYSTGGSSGIGLGAVKRQAEALDVWSDAQGAVVLARVYRRGCGDLALGAFYRAMDGGAVSGDAWAVRVDAQKLDLCVIDGLGHGPEAAKAGCAGVDAFQLAGSTDPASALMAMHRSMSSTRGGAAAVASYRFSASALAFSGVGNVAGRLLSLERSRGLPSMAGIVGGQFRKMQTFDFPDSPGRLLIMHSDGLQTRWDLSQYPGLLLRHPGLICAVLARDFDRGRDDTTLIAVRLDSFK